MGIDATLVISTEGQSVERATQPEQTPPVGKCGQRAEFGGIQKKQAKVCIGENTLLGRQDD